MHGLPIGDGGALRDIPCQISIVFVALLLMGSPVFAAKDPRSSETGGSNNDSPTLDNLIRQAIRAAHWSNREKRTSGLESGRENREMAVLPNTRHILRRLC